MDATQNFDPARFAKVWNLATSIPHRADGGHERAAARRKAEAIARRHGMTLEDAVAAIGGTQDWFPLDPMEEMIRAAGIDLFDKDLVETLPLYRLLRTAIPWPQTIRAAIAEFERWDAIEAERVRAVPSYRLGKAACVRREMVSVVISDYRATSVAEAVARAWWVESRLWRPGRFDFQEKRAVQAMAADMARMAERIAALSKMDTPRPTDPKKRPLRRTAAMKRADVLFILDSPGGEGLSLRAVAEMAGVSPETVRAVKRTKATR